MSGPLVIRLSNEDITVRVQPYAAVLRVMGGIPGPAGPSGSGEGSAPPYVHIQSGAATVWTVHHNRNSFPGITTTQLSGLDDWEVIEGDVLYLDANTIQVTFSAAVSGRAFCS